MRRHWPARTTSADMVVDRPPRSIETPTMPSYPIWAISSGAPSFDR
jgi:hypothetical protein